MGAVARTADVRIDGEICTVAVGVPVRVQVFRRLRMASAGINLLGPSRVMMWPRAGQWEVMGPSVARTLLLTAALLLGGGSAPGWLSGLSGVGMAGLVLLGVLVIAVVVAAVIVVVIWRAIRRD